MKRDELKALGLEDAVIDKIMDLNGTDINAIKGKLTNAEETIQTLQTTIGERDADTQKLNDQIQQSKVNSALELALVSNKARNTKAVKALIDLEKIELNEDGTIKGLDEQLTALKTDNAFLFDGEPQSKDPVPPIGAPAPNSGVSGTIDPFAAALGIK